MLSGIFSMVNLHQFKISVTKILYKSIKNSIKKISISLSDPWRCMCEKFRRVHIQKGEKAAHRHCKWDESCMFDLIISQTIPIFSINIHIYYELEFLISAVLVTTKMNAVFTWIYY